MPASRSSPGHDPAAGFRRRSASVWPRFAAQNLAHRPLVVLFAAAGTEGVLGALLNVAILSWRGGVARLYQLEPFQILARVLQVVHVDPLAHVPVFMRVAWDLSQPRVAFELLVPAVAVHLLFAAVVGGVLAPLAAALNRRFPPSASSAWERFWGRLYPAGVVAAFAVPAFRIICHTLLAGSVGRSVLVTTVAVPAAACVGLVLVLRRPVAVVRLLGYGFGTASVALIVATALAGAAAATSPGARLAPRPAPRHGSPNVVLVSIDTLRADHVHCYGYARETTPAIDGLAREGARFTTVVAPTSWTLPSHVTLFTGLPPVGHGVVRSFLRMRPQMVTLAEVFRDAGYATAGFVSAPYLDAEYGFSRGFDTYDDWSAGSASRGFNMKVTSSPVLLDLVGHWLSGWTRQEPRRPFFVFVHMYDVHADYTPPPPFDTLFDPGYRGWVTGVGVVGDTRFGPGTDPRDLAHLVALYDGGIRFTDLYLGKILDRVRSLGVLDDTIVAVTADHGEEFLEHGHTTHGKNLFDTSLLVPLVIRFPPKVPAGTVVAQQARIMDVPSTVLALAGLTPPSTFGRLHPGQPRACADLSAAVERRPDGEGPALPAFADLRGRLAAVRTGRYTLIIPVRDPASAELYDLEADPEEHTNVAARLPALTDELRRRLLAWRQRWAGDRVAARSLVPDEDLLRRLKALGYAQ
jgi:arylsulfatase A-like enzyme